MRRLETAAISASTLLLLLIAVPASAQTRVGIRAGVSGDPNQFFFGAHVESEPLTDHLTFKPNVEVGVGDQQTLIALNIEFAYHVPLARQPWTLYFGGGPAANVYSVHHGGPTNVNGGLNFMIGVQHTRGFFTELKIGAIDSPSVKFTVGYVFHQ